jgi:hypothetical protein
MEKAHKPSDCVYQRDVWEQILKSKDPSGQFPSLLLVVDSVIFHSDETLYAVMSSRCLEWKKKIHIRILTVKRATMSIKAVSSHL